MPPCSRVRCCVQILFDTQVTSVDIADDESSVVVHARSTPAASAPDDTEASMRFAGRLVVAADGANSRVRQALEKARPGDGWRMHEAPSDAAGLNIKVSPCHQQSSLHQTFGCGHVSTR